MPHLISRLVITTDADFDKAAEVAVEWCSGQIWSAATTNSLVAAPILIPHLLIYYRHCPGCHHDHYYQIISNAFLVII